MTAKKYDAIIVGAGAAGLGAAYGLRGLDVLVIDRGLMPLERVRQKEQNGNGGGSSGPKYSYILNGVGGAGLFSDGKLNFIPQLGKTDLTQFMNLGEATQLINDVEEMFNLYGMDGQVFPSDMERAQEFRRAAMRHGIELMLIKQKHIGSDRLPLYIDGMVSELEKESVNFLPETEVTGVLVQDGRCMGVKSSAGEFYSDNVVLAPGRGNSKWLDNLVSELGLGVKSTPIEIGVRVEVPNEIMDPVTDVIYDPTFFILTKTYDDVVRTFCTNKGGFMATEDYEGFVCVNGHALRDKKSGNTNFALLNKINLTEPITDSYRYGLSIGNLATTLGGGKPLLQRYGDLRRGRRSDWGRLRKGNVTPTMTCVTPGDISMALTKRIVANISESLDRLDEIIPGIGADGTLLYAPEIKFFSRQVDTGKNLETKIGGLYMAGDGAGVSGNIVGAAATGLIAARDIRKKY